ncbi:MAG: hypothetical protein H6R35_1158, partial [Bacteroidetes bacterium]|nr:hypothetical protein [Bacteroidota bacterium]
NPVFCIIGKPLSNIVSICTVVIVTNKVCDFCPAHGLQVYSVFFLILNINIGNKPPGTSLKDISVESDSCTREFRAGAMT